VWLKLGNRDIEYPSGGTLYVDGHLTISVPRRDARPIVFRYAEVSQSSLASFLFSPLVVTGEKAFALFALLELIMDSAR
jgi:hypothetical protein